jgi:hypothetical protein
MDKDKFTAVYSEGRNGTDGFTRHRVERGFAYSDGVAELAQLGCYWLLDILATELPAAFKRNEHVSNMCIVKVCVADRKAKITGEFTNGAVAWKKALKYTDMPSGVWTFYVADDKTPPTPYRMILPSEY